MTTPPLPTEPPTPASGEVHLRDGGANLARGIESVGGKLVLTSLKLSFSPHTINVQSQNEDIDLASISKVERARTMILMVVPGPKNAVAVTLSDGSERRFTVYKGQQWVDAIQAAVDARSVTL